MYQPQDLPASFSVAVMMAVRLPKSKTATEMEEEQQELYIPLLLFKCKCSNLERRVAMKSFARPGTDTVALRSSSTKLDMPRNVSLPDELVSRILESADFNTRLAAHQVSQAWNRILQHPASNRMWKDVSLIETTDCTISGQCQQRMKRSMIW